MNTLRNKLFFLCFCFFTGLIASCGYYNPYLLPTDEQGPPLMIHVPVWTNQTNELGLETVIRNALSDWLIQNKRIILTPKKEEADYLFEGKIVSVSIPGLSYGTDDVATSLKVVLIVQYTIKERKSGQIVRQQNSYVLEEPFSRGGSAAQTEANKKEALKTLADDLGENLYIRAYRALTKHQRRAGNKE